MAIEMPSGPRQLALSLARRPCFDADEFLVAPSNAAAFEQVERWPEWASPVLLLLGPTGSGKSHLAAIWAERTGATVVPFAAVRDAGRWTGKRPVAVLEDCDLGAGDEAALFHTLNMTTENGGWLVLTARTRPDRWGLRTADLLSRLRQAPCVTIAGPEAALTKAVMLKLFADQQIGIDEDVVQFAARHCERSLGAVRRFVAAVDEASLEAGRRITRPLAARVIKRLLDDDMPAPIE